ncbi:T9SS type A sorting domain-containing protein [Tenacibaculum sp.]|nr:T9SS type A sorting domain-containing protein [Tenacibaculum sp.]
MKFTTFLFLFSLPIIGFSQNNCECDHIINNLSNTYINVIKGDSFNYKSGDVFCIESGTYKGLRLIDFNGERNSPLIFKNINGEVFFNEPSYPAIELKESKYIRFTGSGDDNFFYGFKVESTNTVAVAVSEFSSDVELDHLKIEKSGFAGIMAKTNPRCNEPKTWRRNGFILKNLKIHHNYIKNTEGEGLYIGSTDGYKIKSRLKCNNEYTFPHWLENVEIYNNKIENTNWDGIQVNMVRKNGQIHNNTIIGYGSTTNTYQNFAMSIGGGTYSVYNNFIKNLNAGKGMQFISIESDTKVFNNVIINPKDNGIFIHSRHELSDKTRGYFFLNNTIINPEKSGIAFYTSIQHSLDPSLINTLQIDVPSYFINNIIVNPGNNYETTGTWKNVSENYIDFNAPAEKNYFKNYISSNLFSKNIDEVGFVDYSNDNYKSNPNAIKVINKGEDLIKYGITNDFNDISRPQNGSFDLGAYELKQTISNKVFFNKQIKTKSLIAYPNPINDTFTIVSKGKIKSAEIYNLNGDLVMTILSPKNNRFSISKLKSGIYFCVILKGNNNKETVQIVKK